MTTNRKEIELFIDNNHESDTYQFSNKQVKKHCNKLIGYSESVGNKVKQWRAIVGSQLSIECAKLRVGASHRPSK